MKSSLFIFICTFTLTSCNDKIDFNLTLQPTTSFALKTDKKKTINFEPSQSSSFSTTYQAKKERLILNTFDRDAITFKNVKWNQGTMSIELNPADSNQKTLTGSAVGLQAKLTVVCNPECETKTVTEEVQGCTYYLHQPVTRCYPLPNGGSDCRTYWEDIAYPGQQHVELTRVTKNYTVTGNLFTKSENLSSANGEFTSTDTTARAISSCR